MSITTYIFIFKLLKNKTKINISHFPQIAYHRLHPDLLDYLSPPSSNKTRKALSSDGIVCQIYQA